MQDVASFRSVMMRRMINNNNNNNKQEENRSRLPTSRSNFHSKDFMQEPSSVNYLKESLY